jgi:hypothetical protein
VVAVVMVVVVTGPERRVMNVPEVWGHRPRTRNELAVLHALRRQVGRPGKKGLR